MLAVLPERERRLEGLDNIHFSLRVVVPRWFVGEDEDISGHAVDEDVEPSVACNHSASQAKVSQAGFLSDDALKTGRGEGQRTDDVHQGVYNHHVGGLVCLGGLARAEMIVLDAPADDVVKRAVKKDGSKFSNEDPEVVAPKTKLGIFAVDPALMGESVVLRMGMGMRPTQAPART